MDKLPNQIPLFPLTGAILLPKGHLPLNIFEPRYKDMVEHSRRGAGIIGMIQPAATDMSKTTDGNDLFGTAERGRPLYNIGCAGQISTYEETPEGQYYIVLTGVKRFNIVEEVSMKNGFREALVDYTDYSNDGSGILTNPKPSKEHFLKTFKNYVSNLNLRIDFNAFEDIEDEELVNWTAMICPFDAAEKQLLIECPSITDRLCLMDKLITLNASGHNMSAKKNIH